MSITPGFAAYLERIFKECDMQHTVVMDEDKKVGRTVHVDKGVTRGDVTVVDVKHSSNIKRLHYEDKVLTTTFMNGGVSVYAGVDSDTFNRVANPGAEFEHSVGKAHYALIVKPRKKVR